MQSARIRDSRLVLSDMLSARDDLCWQSEDTMSTTEAITTLDRAGSAQAPSPAIEHGSKRLTIEDRPIPASPILNRSILLGLDRDNLDRRNYLRRRWQSTAALSLQ
jgi:hypothetical protein